MTDTWSDRAIYIQKHMANESIDEFLRWSTISATMFVGNAPYIDKEYDTLKKSPDWDLWSKAILDTGIGKPITYYRDGRTSGNMIHQAYHLCNFVDKFGLNLKNYKRIVEIGGGYGAMRLVVDRMGFEGEYTIVDLPEVSYLQQWYLGWHGVETEFRTKAEPGHYDLMIAIHSLSEIPSNLRDEYLDKMTADLYLIGIMGTFNDVDIQKYFIKWILDQPGDWFIYPAVSFPNTIYCLGNTKD